MSSSYKTLQDIYASSEALLGCFIKFYENTDEDNETRYEVRGSDYFIELCCILDVFKVVTDMMVLSQAVSVNIWSVLEWCPRTLNLLEKMEKQLQKKNLKEIDGNLFPTLFKHKEELASQKFNGIELLEGWLIKESSPKSKNLNEWKMRDDDEVLCDLAKLTEDVRKSIARRFNNENLKKQVSDLARLLHPCFSLREIFNLLQGSRKDEDEKPMYTKGINNFERQGLLEFREFFSYVVQLPHIKEIQERENLLFESDFSNQIFSNFKHTLKYFLWEEPSHTLLSKWFYKCPSVKKESKLLNFSLIEDELNLRSKYKFYWSDGTYYEATLEEEEVFASFYTCKEVYEKAGRETCVCLDIALAKGGSEAIVETFYSMMGNQQFQGGQNNDTLANRSIVNWLFPLHKRMESLYIDVARLYLNGSERLGLSRHRDVFLRDPRERSKYKEQSKVLKRIEDSIRSNFFDM